MRACPCQVHDGVDTLEGVQRLGVVVDVGLPVAGAG